MREALRTFQSAVLLALVASPAFAAAETLQSANVDSRLMLFVQAPEAAVKKRLPPGFRLSAFGEGPYQGTNVILAFFERLHASDAAGKAQAPVQNRSLLLVIPVKNPAGSPKPTFVVLGGWTSDPGYVPGPYKNFTLATAFRREHASKGAGNAYGTGEERWFVEGGAAGSVEARLRFARSMPTRVPAAEQHIYSSVDPAFYRIYRFDAGYEMVRTTGGDRSDEASLTVKGPWLADLFDGTEKLVAIINVPWYVRQVFLP